MVYFRMYLILLVLDISSSNQNESKLKRFKKKSARLDIKFDKIHKVLSDLKVEQNLKYILRWKTAGHDTSILMDEGQQGFIQRKCLYTNCVVTSQKNYLENITNFDVIVFSGPDLLCPKALLPNLRSPLQKYAYISKKPGKIYSTFLDRFDGYFNWTWTYRLDSDLRWGFIVITDINGNVVGPRESMNWIKKEDMLPVKNDLKEILQNKTLAVAWISSNCDTASNREIQVEKLQNILNIKYNLDLHIYGYCGVFKYIKDDDTEYYEFIRENYYFYLAYEEFLSEDYVTDELMRAIRYNTVPIVYGGANYSRFLPEGSYINARILSTEDVAAKMYELINNFEKYVEYFKWTNYYKYYRTVDLPKTDEYCKMCELLNDENKIKEYTIVNTLRSWWDPSKYKINNSANVDVTSDGREVFNMTAYLRLFHN